MTVPSSRPLSPHLSIYRFTWLMAGSIIHRLTGAALYFGALLLLWGLVALSLGPDYYQVFLAFTQSLLGKLVLFGFTWALMQHSLGGLRHLIWDTGRGLSVPVARRLTIAGFAGSALLTLLVWFYAGVFS